MRRPSALFLALLIPAFAAAEPVGAPQTPRPQTMARKDPKGVTGVSPLWELIVKGDAAAVARDFDGAIRIYREAIALSPESPVPHYRTGQAFALKGALDEAEAAYAAALEKATPKADPEGSLRAKVLFCIADLHERRKATDRAIAAWTEYETHAKANPKAKLHLGSLADRKQRNEALKKNLADAAEVKRRIEAPKKDAAKR